MQSFAQGTLRELFDAASDSEKSGFFEYVIHECIGCFCLPGTSAVDVGANGGAHTVHMARSVRESGHVYAFEPDPSIAPKLEEIRASYPWVELLLLALSDHNGVQAFYLDECSALSSLNLRPHQPTSVQRQIEIEVARLDDVAALRSASNIRLIKVDIEGEELRFLSGAERTIKAHRPIVLLEIDWSYVFDIDRGRYAAGEHEKETAAFLAYLGQYAGGYVLGNFFGSTIDQYDPWSWNVALVPNDWNVQETCATLKSFGEKFFRSHRSWRLY